MDEVTRAQAIEAISSQPWHSIAAPLITDSICRQALRRGNQIGKSIGGLS